MDQNRQKQFADVPLVIVILILIVSFLACGQATPTADVEATVAAGIAATQQAEANAQATVEAAVIATQTANQAASQETVSESDSQETVSQGSDQLNPPTPETPNTGQDLQQVREVIIKEVNGATTRDLTLLKSLYASTAIVIDHNGTPNDSSDDTIWQGWINIERRYQEFFSNGFTSAELVGLSIQTNVNQATATHQGAIFDGIFYDDIGIYTLEKTNNQWFIVQLEYGYKKHSQPKDDGLYVLEIGSQHRYEEPWGWDRGDPCEAWRTNNWDDTKPNYRGFNLELLLTNNSEKKIPDDWSVSFTTANGNSVRACNYIYEGAGPPPGATSSVTFFTVVEKGDFVEKIVFELEGQTVQICLDGKGNWWKC
jgi:hypothetical protein